MDSGPHHLPLCNAIFILVFKDTSYETPLSYQWRFILKIEEIICSLVYTKLVIIFCQL